MTYDEEIEIDEQALDVEWLNQPKLMLKYTRARAEAQRELDMAKEIRDVTRARVDKAIREDPEKHGVVAGPRGITEGGITAAIADHPDYIKANRAYVDSSYEFNVATGVVAAFDQRKTALENLVRLHGQSYFAGPKVPHDLGEMRRQKDEEAQRGVKIRRRT